MLTPRPYTKEPALGTFHSSVPMASKSGMASSFFLDGGPKPETLTYKGSEQPVPVILFLRAASADYSGACIDPSTYNGEVSPSARELPKTRASTCSLDSRHYLEDHGTLPVGFLCL